MTYVENVYICLAAPILLAILYLQKSSRRSLVFLLCGMTSCLFSAYVSTYLAEMAGVGAETAAHQISPAVEEIIKILPLLFYILVLKPEKINVYAGTFMVSVGFATFENVCFLLSHGSEDLQHLLVRGFGTGAMHVVCGMIVASGLYILWDKVWLRIAGVFAFLSFAVTLHAVYNIFVSHSGVIFWIGSAVPLVIILIYLVFLRNLNLDV
ncbi:MAG: PrsW family intramembrane metalloprotease [Lachnospiraceae bacterium]|nr:PrsW family intramembrane metalloprotease [Lachnospiraceae bacterium]